MTSNAPKIWRYVLALGLFLGGGWLVHRRLQGQRTANHVPPKPDARILSPVATVHVSTGTIGIGGSLSKSLGHAGLSSLLISQLEKSLTPLFNPHNSKSIDTYTITQSTGGNLVELTYWPNRLQYFSVRVSTSGVFSASKKEVQLTHSTVGVRGEIHSSLWESMHTQGVPPDVIVRFAEIFGWRIDFLTEPRKGDTYELVWTRSEGNGAVRDDEILCASYTSHGRGQVWAYPLAGEFYDAKGESLRGEFLRAPLVYRRISSYFTESRFHPILRIYRPHHGIDYSAPYGTPASSIADGVVTAKGWGGGIGNQVRVRHSGSYVSIYGHLSRFASGLHVGSHVRQGQVIGFVGSTGLSTGPHLHFGFEQNGTLINFFSLKLGASRHEVPANERPHFAAIKEQAAARLAQIQTIGAPVQHLNTEQRGQAVK